MNISVGDVLSLLARLEMCLPLLTRKDVETLRNIPELIVVTLAMEKMVSDD